MQVGVEGSGFHGAEGDLVFGGTIPYLECDGGYITVYICQN